MYGLLTKKPNMKCSVEVETRNDTEGMVQKDMRHVVETEERKGHKSDWINVFSE